MIPSGIENRSLPFFGTVEDAVRACARVVRYAQWRQRNVGSIEEPENISPVNARRIVDAELSRVEVVVAEGDETDDPRVSLTALDPDAGLTRLLGEYGISVLRAVEVSSESEAVEAADRLGYPVVLKTLDRRFAARTDLGGVRLNLENPGEILTAFSSMAVDRKSVV